jgi:hypothetical protein
MRTGACVLPAAGTCATSDASDNPGNVAMQA